MVTRAREGTSVRYALAGDEVLALWLALRDASVARLAEVERAARDYLGEDVEAIGRDELIARLRAGDVVLVDVRPAEEFEAGHIDGRALDPDRRARAPAGRAAGRPRGRRLLPRPVLRLRARGGPPARRRRDARRGAWRTAGPSGGWPRRATRSGVAPREHEKDEMRAIDLSVRTSLHDDERRSADPALPEHVDRDHPEMQRTEEQLRERIAADACEPAVA